MIYIENLTKKYNDKTVLDKINIHFNNKLNFLYGENGSGKTTLINLIAGIIKPNTGSIYFNGIKISYIDGKYKKDIGFLLDFPTYPYHYKVIEYINLLEEVYCLKKNEKYFNYKNDLISFFELKDYLKININNLSTGYLKKLKLFATMIHNPSFFILDEPFSGIDKDFLPKIIHKLKELSNNGKGFIITTHLNLNEYFSPSEIESFFINNSKIQVNEKK